MPLKFSNFARYLEGFSLDDLKLWKQSIDRELEYLKRQAADLQKQSDDLSMDIYTLENMQATDKITGD